MLDENQGIRPTNSIGSYIARSSFVLSVSSTCSLCLIDFTVQKKCRVSCILPGNSSCNNPWFSRLSRGGGQYSHLLRLKRLFEAVASCMEIIPSTGGDKGEYPSYLGSAV
jgi:hypothetical protein